MLPITIEVQNKNYNLVKIFIEKGVDLNALNEKCDDMGVSYTFSTLYELCSQEPNLEMITYFIDHGTD